jgi:hypothetical protein
MVRISDIRSLDLSDLIECCMDVELTAGFYSRSVATTPGLLHILRLFEQTQAAFLVVEQSIAIAYPLSPAWACRRALMSARALYCTVGRGGQRWSWMSRRRHSKI